MTNNCWPKLRGPAAQRPIAAAAIARLENTSIKNTIKKKRKLETGSGWICPQARGAAAAADTKQPAADAAAPAAASSPYYLFK